MNARIAQRLRFTAVAGPMLVSRLMALLAGLVLCLAATLASAQIIKGSPRPPPSPDDLVGITAGNDHTCVTKRNGKVYCWGRNDLGQAGVASTVMCVYYFCVDQPRFVTMAALVDAGDHHTCTLDAAGNASCWGNNGQGQLGIASQPPYYSAVNLPTPVTGGHQFSSISAGHASTCGLTLSGTYCWGAIAAGSTSPWQIAGWNPYQQRVSVGYMHACAIYVVGSWRGAGCWGNNTYGQAGVDPAQLPFPAPAVQASFDTTLTALSAQAYTTCADQSSGRVQCVGYNGSGELGNGNNLSTFQAQTVGMGMALSGVSSGLQHSCALNPAGQAFCWGNGWWGQLGNGVSGLSNSPQAVTGGRSYRAIAAGYQHTCAIGTDNHIYCWGSNYHGQLGTRWPGGWVSNPVLTLDP